MALLFALAIYGAYGSIQSLAKEFGVGQTEPSKATGRADSVGLSAVLQ